MKKLESTLPNMLAVLTCICIVAAALLGMMNEVTKDPIAQIEQKNLEEGIKKVILGANASGDLTVSKIDTIVEDKQVYIVYTAEQNGKELGKAVKTAVQGFSPDLTVLTGFDAEGNVMGYEILKHGETPGLGAQAPEWFKDKENNPKSYIIGMNPGKNKMTVSKDGGEIDAITASTITSRAFLKAINMEYNTLFKGNAETGATKKAEPASCDSTAVAANDSTAVAEKEAQQGGALTIKVVEVEE